MDKIMSVRYKHNAILRALALLDPYHPGFTGSEEIAALLKRADLHGYIWAWVLPALHTADGDLSYRWNRVFCDEEATRITRAVLREQRIAELQKMRETYIINAGAMGKAAAATWDGLEGARKLQDLLLERQQRNPNYTPMIKR
jgi:hypothetical protein